MPAGLWQRLAPAGRLSILRHELAHLQRRDLLKSILVRLLMLPHWFNPLAWLAVRRFDEAAEWACDEVAKGADLEGCRAYAAALLQLDAACGPRPSYHAAASGRGLSVRVQRLLSPQVKEDSIMKKTTILGIALGLALLCLVRLDLVAKEPAEKDRAENSSRKAQRPCRLKLRQPKNRSVANRKSRKHARVRRRPALHAQRLPGYFLGRRGRTAQNQPSLAEKSYRSRLRSESRRHRPHYGWLARVADPPRY